MKWYWILLIALGALAVGILIASAIKSKSKTTAELKPDGGKEFEPKSKPKVSSQSGVDTEIVKQENGNGTTTTILRKTS